MKSKKLNLPCNAGIFESFVHRYTKYYLLSQSFSQSLINRYKNVSRVKYFSKHYEFYYLFDAKHIYCLSYLTCSLKYYRYYAMSLITTCSARPPANDSPKTKESKIKIREAEDDGNRRERDHHRRHRKLIALEFNRRALQNGEISLQCLMWYSTSKRYLSSFSSVTNTTRT